MPPESLLPIVYLRGYAGNQGGVESTVDDPFYGFNTGSTHIRVGPHGNATFFAFEGPVIRLMGDYGYRDAFDRGVQLGSPQSPAVPPRSVPWQTVWIHRYYDLTSKAFEGSPGRRLEIEDAAAALRDLVDRIKEMTGAPAVILIGHSTGGLIIRSLLQKLYPQDKVKPTDHVHKVFTYGTPHGGIHFDLPGGPAIEWARDHLGWNNMDDFGRERMYGYLTPDRHRKKSVPDDFEPRSLGGAFPVDRVFCLVGTDAADYGLPKHAVGARSDGLVQIDSAYVIGAPRAYVHRAHSGRYGLVNSEEGYQNLKRFLFGEVRVDLLLDDLDHLERLRDPDVFHHAEVSVSVRELPVVMHEQTLDHYCPVPLEWKQKQEGEPIFLFRLFLIPSLAGDRPARYAVSLAVHRIERKEGRLWFRDHLEKIPLWTDNLIVDVISAETREGRTEYTARYGWRSQMPHPDADPPAGLDMTDVGGGVESRIDLPASARSVLGDKAVLVVRAGWWQ